MEYMAREIQRGANSVEGIEATLWQVLVSCYHFTIYMWKLVKEEKGDDIYSLTSDSLYKQSKLTFFSVPELTLGHVKIPINTSNWNNERFLTVDKNIDDAVKTHSFMESIVLLYAILQEGSIYLK